MPTISSLRAKTNRITINGDVATIHVIRRDGTEMMVIADSSDVPLLSQYTWHVAQARNFWYAYTQELPMGKRWSMHQLLIQADPKFEIDHKDHNGLNNRRENLRVVPHWVNRHNHARKCSNVYFVSNKWRVGFRIKYKRRWIGAFDTKAEADLVAARIREQLLRGEVPDYHSEKYGP